MPTAQEIRAQRARFLNAEMQELYQYKLVQCPQCSTINSLPIDADNDDELDCNGCDIPSTIRDCHNLFE